MLKIKFFHIVAFLVGLLIWVITLSFISPLSGHDIELFVLVRTFIIKYWMYIALVLSETAAFLPVPLNGILQAVIKFISLLVKNNSSNH